MAVQNLLLVEGKDDKHVFWNLLEYHEVPERFTVEDVGGIPDLFDALEVWLDTDDLERIGIVVDADADLKSRWLRIGRVLKEAGKVDFPELPNPNGTILELQQELRVVKVGIWVMPNNKLPGILEDFVSFLVPAGDQLWERAKDCVDQIPDTERRFPTQRTSKAYIHTYLAWQEEPGRPLGQAISKRYLDPDAPHVDTLITWIRNLFELD